MKQTKKYLVLKRHENGEVKVSFGGTGFSPDFFAFIESDSIVDLLVRCDLAKIELSPKQRNDLIKYEPDSPFLVSQKLEAIANIKLECKETIISRFSEAAQLNALRRATRLQNNRANVELTPAEVEELARFEAADDWINIQLANCQSRINELLNTD